MTAEEAQGSIIDILSEVLRDKGQQQTEMRPESLLLGGGLGIDSLDLAVVVIRMAELAGKDPFQNGFIDFQTVGEMASLYAG